jgi:hypothetical protein
MHPVPQIEWHFAGGVRDARYARVHDFEFGGGKAQVASFLVPPDESRIGGADGVLAGDFLYNYDVDLDFANAKLNLFEHHPCAGHAVYWTQDSGAIATIPFEYGAKTHSIMVPIELDGHPLKAIVDTAAVRSQIDLEDAMKMVLSDVKPGSPVLTHVGEDQVGERKGEVYRYSFKMLTMEGLTVNNPAIFLVQHLQNFERSKAILGISILRQLHLYIAYQEHVIYATPAGAH